MNDNEINEAIAKACGWKLKSKKFKSTNAAYRTGYRYERGSEAACSGGECHGWGWSNTPESAAMHLPPYCTDLNAMHEAEKNLTEWHKYRYAINEIVWNQRDKKTGIAESIIHATARQRAEAFLRTKGLWKVSCEDETK